MLPASVSRKDSVALRAQADLSNRFGRVGMPQVYGCMCKYPRVLLRHDGPQLHQSGDRRALWRQLPSRHNQVRARMQDKHEQHEVVPYT